jgi:hypothetical protein
VIILVIFMLIQRENLRNRLIRFMGYGRLTVTTKALEEAGRRIIIDPGKASADLERCGVMLIDNPINL